MVTQRFADLEDGPELFMADARDASAAARCAGDLVEVAPDRTQLAYDLLQGDQLVLRQRFQRSKVGSEEHRRVRGRGHSPSRRTLVQQQAILLVQANVQARDRFAAPGALSRDHG